jgi:general secretion pathway protein G
MLRKNNNRGILIHIRSQGGLTLIELMVVLVILGLLAGLVFQRFTPQIDKAKEQTAITQMEILGLALDNYRLDVGAYPDSLEELVNSSADGWRGPYLKKNRIPDDPWGNPYTYEVVEDGGDYRISSTAGGKGSINSWE